MLVVCLPFLLYFFEFNAKGVLYEVVRLNYISEAMTLAAALESGHHLDYFCASGFTLKYRNNVSLFFHTTHCIRVCTNRKLPYTIASVNTVHLSSID